jgi:hypothetical protein
MADHIFNTTEQIIAHYPFLNTTPFDRLKPSMKFVERRYIPQLMDSNTWSTLLQKLEDDPIADPWKELVELTRDACAYLIAAHWIPHGNVMIGAQGLQVAKSDTMVPASKDRKNDLLRGIHEQATDTLDLIIEHLHANLNTYSDYKNSDLYAEHTKSLIGSSIEFTNLYPIGTNRWVWRQIVPWRNKAELSRIIGTLGEDYHKELVMEANGVDGAELDAVNEPIFKMARQALAFATIELAILHLGLRIEEHGVTVYNNASNATNDLRTPAEIERTKLAAEQAKAESDRLLQEIEKELRENASATKYATFFNSEAYVAPEDVTVLNDTELNENPGNFNGL